MLASALVLAGILVSCKTRLAEAELLDPSKAPVQTVNGMFALNSTNGKLSMRAEAPTMARYETDTATLDTFPEGFYVYGYNEEGQLETIINADNARHVVNKRKKDNELWEAFGNVVVNNVIKRERMETDTLYWDRGKNEIYTDCYVKMISEDGFMQGYGMRSDDHARTAIIHRPFDSFGYTKQDTTVVLIDSVNFIGPLLKK
ncbi:MAG: LPS export ABC transporter periplasmic protein LptC [Bacteroidales bacterium]|nr:LPS export ABC transporter periplasmic protein LptC [Bacteroidales bacterium]